MGCASSKLTIKFNSASCVNFGESKVDHQKQLKVIEKQIKDKHLGHNSTYNHVTDCGRESIQQIKKILVSVQKVIGFFILPGHNGDSVYK